MYKSWHGIIAIMTNILSFVEEYFYLYVWLIVTTFINIVAPMAGSTIVNPVTAYFTDPQRAIGIGASIFFCTGIHRIYLFRKEIFEIKENRDIIKTILPYTIIGAILGGSFVSYLNTKVLVILIVIVSMYYVYKTLLQIYKHKSKVEKSNHFSKVSVSTLSGFLQGAGMPGSNIRDNYLRTFLSEVSVRAVTTVIGVVNFFIAGTIIFLHNHLTYKDLIFIVSVVPLLVPAQMYGKIFLDKMDDKNAKIVAISLSLLGVILLTYKYLV